MRAVRRGSGQGRIDRMAGRVMDTFGRLTGRRSTKAKGRAARARGGARGPKGRTKRRRRR